MSLTILHAGSVKAQEAMITHVMKTDKSIPGVGGRAPGQTGAFLPDGQRDAVRIEAPVAIAQGPADPAA